MIASSTSLSDPDAQRGFTSSDERGEHRSYSGVGIATSHLTTMPDSRVNDKLAAVLSRRDPWVTRSKSSSTATRLVGRLGASASMRRLPSSRTMPTSSWRSNHLLDAHKTYSKIDSRHDGDGSDTPNPPNPRGTVSSRHSSSGNPRYHSRRRRRRQEKCSGSQNAVHSSVHVSNLLARFSHPMTMTNGRHHHSSSRSTWSSLGTPQLSFDGHVPFPSISSEESYPSPYSPDAIALFEAPLDSEVPFVDGLLKHHDSFEDHVRFVLVEPFDRTSTSAGSTTATPPLSRRRGLLASFKRRVRALAKSASPTRRKFPTIFRKDRRARYLVDDDNDPVEYDIPCLAYVTCLW